MAKIHRNDMPVQHPTQTITLPKEPEPAAPKATTPQFYDQDKDADYEAPHPAKGKGSAAKAGKAKSKKDLAYTIAMVVFAVIFLVSGGLLVKRFFDDKKTENEFSDLQLMIDVAATPAPAEDSEPSNAAKFAAKGTTITVQITKKDGKAYTSIRNLGATIPPDELSLLFDRFHKADYSRSMDREGVGLGLYIVKTILGNLKENITVTSEDGVTNFTFTLTLA